MNNFSCPYANLKSCKYLKPNTEASVVNKGIVKTRLIVDMVRKGWSRIFAARCGLHYVVSARFGSFWEVRILVQPKKFEYLFFTAMKIHTIPC